MLSGAWRVLAGFAATVGMWAFFAVILPVAVMIVTLYVVRLLPLVGRRGTRSVEPLKAPGLSTKHDIDPS